MPTLRSASCRIRSAGFCLRVGLLVEVLLALVLVGCGGGSTGRDPDVPAPNQPPVLAPVEARTVVAGDELILVVSATDPDGPEPLVLRAIGLPAGADFVDLRDGNGRFSWTPSGAAVLDGPYVVRFTATDGAGLRDEAIAVITVLPMLPSNTPPVFDPVGDRSVRVGEVLSFFVTATDPDGPPPVLSASGLPRGAAFSDDGDGTGVFSWAPEIAQISRGPYTITFTAVDADDPLLSSTLEVDVTVSFIEEFTAGASDWFFVGDVPESIPSWLVADGVLQQGTKVESVRSFENSYHRGTYAYLPAGSGLSDYRLHVDAVYLATEQANDIGVMFRYQDNDNYYRLSMNARYGFTRLEKRVSGQFSPLAVNGRGYTPGALLRFEVEVRGNLITVWIDGDLVFAIEDDSLSAGTVGLYTQDQSAFERVIVEGASPTPFVALAAPVAFTVGVANAVVAAAAAPLVPPGGTVEFTLVGRSTAVDDRAPFSAEFGSLPAGDYAVTATLRDAGGTNLAQDTNLRIGVGGEYFIAIGDSITNGIGDRYSRDNRSQSGRVRAVQGYQAPLVDLLDSSLQRPVMAYNAGIGGDQSFQAAFLRVDSILARHPGSNKALVLLGTNDALAAAPSGLGCLGSGCDGTFKGNMQVLVDKLNAADKTVYVARTPPVFGSCSTCGPHSNPRASLQNTTIEEYISVIDNELSGLNSGPDFFSFFLGPTVNRFSLFEDPLHPNALGHAVIAHLWHNALNPGAPVALPFMLENLAPSTVAPYLKQNLLEPGNTYYVDRDHRLTAIPEVLRDGVWIMTANNDAGNGSDAYLGFAVSGNAEVYVAYDAGASALPAWMGEFTNTGLLVETSNPQASSMMVYRRVFTAGTVSLGGNMAAGAVGASANYLVIVKPL